MIAILILYMIRIFINKIKKDNLNIFIGNLIILIILMYLILIDSINLRFFIILDLIIFHMN